MDTGIESLGSATKVFDFDALGFPNRLKEKIIQDVNDNITDSILLTNESDSFLLSKNEDGNLVYKKLLMNHGDSNEMFEMEDESDGTRRLFDLIPMLSVNQRNSVFVIDEIDRCMHSLLTKEFLVRFFDKHQSDTSQIIFTTHDTNLMDLDLFRQDEIWFVNRNIHKASELYSLNKFKVRFDKIPQNDYLIGRYGAIPFFKEIFEDDQWNDATDFASEEE